MLNLETIFYIDKKPFYVLNRPCLNGFKLDMCSSEDIKKLLNTDPNKNEFSILSTDEETNDDCNFSISGNTISYPEYVEKRDLNKIRARKASTREYTDTDNIYNTLWALKDTTLVQDGKLSVISKTRITDDGDFVIVDTNDKSTYVTDLTRRKLTFENYPTKVLKILVNEESDKVNELLLRVGDYYSIDSTHKLSPDIQKSCKVFKYMKVLYSIILKRESVAIIMDALEGFLTDAKYNGIITGAGGNSGFKMIDDITLLTGYGDPKDPIPCKNTLTGLLNKADSMTNKYTMFCNSDYKNLSGYVNLVNFVYDFVEKNKDDVKALSGFYKKVEEALFYNSLLLSMWRQLIPEKMSSEENSFYSKKYKTGIGFISG